MFTDDELQVLETALMCYRETVAKDAAREPDEDIKVCLNRWAFVAQDLMLKLDIDPVEPEYEMNDD
jgi:hypothetical protein